MRYARGALVVASLASLATAQTPSPTPTPRPRPRTTPAPKAAATPAPKPTPTPVPLTDQLLAVVANTPQSEPEREIYRKMLLAEIADHRGQVSEAAALLDESEKAILALPEFSGFDKKGINFSRMSLWWSWLAQSMKRSPERALAGWKPFAGSSNPLYSSGLLTSLAKRVDCAQPSQKAALEANIAEAFDNGKLFANGTRESWGVRSLRAAIRADSHCGGTARAAAAAPIIESVVKRARKAHVECEMLVTRGWTRMPAVERALASFREDTATDFSDHIERCESARLSFAAEVLEKPGAGDASKPALVAFIDAAVVDLTPQVAEAATDPKAKKPKGPLPSKGSSFYDLSSAAGSLKQLAAHAPDSAAAGAQRLLELWTSGWTPSAQGGSYILPSIAGLGAALAKAGKQPGWLCGLPAITPKQEIKAEGQAALQSERVLAAAELVAACPSESDALLKPLRAAEDASLSRSVVVRVSRIDPARAETLARGFWSELPADKRYDFAYGVVARLLAVPEE